MTDKVFNPSDLAVTVTIQKAFGEGSGVSYTTSFLQSTSLAEMNAVNDKLAAALRRQEQWDRIGRLEVEIEQQLRQLEQVKAGLASLPDLDSPSAQERNVRKDTLAQGRAGISRIEGIVATLRTLIAGTKADLGVA